MHTLGFEPQTNHTLSHATALIGLSTEELEYFITGLAVHHADTVTLDAAVNGGIKVVHEFASHLLLSPQFGPVRLGVILHADLLTFPAQSALLKLLEEPPASIKIIMSIKNESAVLATVLSRCRRYYGRSSGGVKTYKKLSRDILQQLSEVEELAKEEDVRGIVESWLTQTYEAWVNEGRPKEGEGELERLLSLYVRLGGTANKRLLLEEFVVSSL